jgi:hypothetical protein
LAVHIVQAGELVPSKGWWFDGETKAKNMWLSSGSVPIFRGKRASIDWRPRS